MALPLAKLTILVGAGIAGSILAKEGRIPTFSDVFSGTFKMVWKQIRHDDSTPSIAKPRNDSLLLQVNSLRQELQLLASNRSVTIVTSSGSGSRRCGIIIVVVAVGGYVFWKGWKFPFATRRNLSDACNTIGEQLKTVYSSIASTKKYLSSRIDCVDSSLDGVAELTAATREEVSELSGEMKMVGVEVQSVQKAFQTLETKINRIEGKQERTNAGVRRLVDFTRSLENSGTTEFILPATPSSSRPALEMPQMTPSSRTGSLPPILPVEPPSRVASNGSHKRPLQSAVSTSGLKELNGLSEAIEALSSPDVSNGVRAMEDSNSGNSGSLLFGLKLSGTSASVLTRSRSAVQCSASVKVEDIQLQ